MPTLNDILKKDITREIEGVVKADDSRRIAQEISEYVITREISKLLRRLFEGYQEAAARRVQGAEEVYPYNGVWISGYFGSGKSHLLKILAYLMSGEADEELRATFLEKIKDEWLRGAVEAAFRVPSRSVLFNIDQQADAEPDDPRQVILLVFEKVFNRALGYCDDDPVIADFERDLDERGELDEFKAVFQETAGESWESRRDAVMTIDRKLFLSAWTRFKGESESEANTLLDHYDSSRSLTAEKFAKRVAGWLDRQDTGDQRVNFYVDEVGQFVANRRDRMLNLQTVAETLATVCENRAWVFVTSQEDLDSVIGDANQEQRNDFSRITARFYFRLALTSANVEEVIQERLLAKKEEGAALLHDYYTNEADHIRTLYHFGQGVKEVQFQDATHFALSYPFLAYQFYYLQEALKGLSVHNAFTGRHVSRGERSMLEVFQDVGKQMSDAELYRFATFDRMFDGIRNTLQGGLLAQINLAEDHVSNPLAIRILKTLLMLKYVKDFVSNVENLTTLLMESPHEDRRQLKTNVQSALDTLEYESYVERNGDAYEYLTDREKDVEVEIKNISVEYSDLRRFIGQVVVDKILKTNKFTYAANDQAYTVAVHVDDEQYRKGPTELSLRVVTHLHPQAGDTSTILNQSMGKKELLVMLSVDKRVDGELRLFQQTQIFLNHSSASDDPVRERIISEKRSQNGIRERRLRDELIPALIESADLYVADRKLDAATRDPRQRLIDAAQDLISSSFPNLRLLAGAYTESTLQTILMPSDGNRMFSGDAVGFGEDEAEMQAFLQRQQRDGKHTSVATLKDQFSGGQYGWHEWAVLGVVAKLVAREAVELVEGSDVLSVKDVYGRLLKSHGHEQITVRLAEPIDTSLVTELATFFQEFFHKPATASGGKELVVSIKEELLELKAEIQTLVGRADSYGFLEQLGPFADRYAELAAKEYRALADEISAEGDALLMDKLETVDPARKFMEGSGRTNFDAVRTTLQRSSDNFHALKLGSQLSELESYLTLEKPWAANATKKALDVHAAAVAKIKEGVEDLRTKAITAIDDARDALEKNAAFAELDSSQQQSVLAPLTVALRGRAEKTTSIAALEAILASGIQAAAEECLKEIHTLAHPEKKVRYASPAEKRFRYSDTELVTVEDVAAYVDALREHYTALVKAGKRIGL